MKPSRTARSRVLYSFTVFYISRKFYSIENFRSKDRSSFRREIDNQRGNRRGVN